MSIEIYYYEYYQTPDSIINKVSRRYLMKDCWNIAHKSWVPLSVYCHFRLRTLETLASYVFPTDKMKWPRLLCADSQWITYINVFGTDSVATVHHSRCPTSARFSHLMQWALHAEGLSLTSPQGHILFQYDYAPTDWLASENNILMYITENLGFLYR
jgi:hypothetical protein